MANGQDDGRSTAATLLWVWLLIGAIVLFQLALFFG